MSEFNHPSLIDSFPKLNFLPENAISIKDQTYIKTSLLGQGDTGTVHQAYLAASPSEKLVMKHYFRTDSDSRKMFTNELQVLEKLGLLSNYDSKRLIIIEKHIPGVSLSDALLNAKSMVEVKNLKFEFLKAVNNFHEKTGFIHGDLHPGNAIINQKGEITLIDFGHSYDMRSIFWVPSKVLIKMDLRRATKNFDDAVKILKQKKNWLIT